MNGLKQYKTIYKNQKDIKIHYYILFRRNIFIVMIEFQINIFNNMQIQEIYYYLNQKV